MFYADRDRGHVADVGGRTADLEVAVEAAAVAGNLEAGVEKGPRVEVALREVARVPDREADELLLLCCFQRVRAEPSSSCI